MHTIFIYEHSSGRLTLSFVKSDYVRDTGGRAVPMRICLRKYVNIASTDGGRPGAAVSTWCN